MGMMELLTAPFRASMRITVGLVGIAMITAGVLVWANLSWKWGAGLVGTGAILVLKAVF